jgi:hypothetical protein
VRQESGRRQLRIERKAEAPDSVPELVDIRSSESGDWEQSFWVIFAFAEDRETASTPDALAEQLRWRLS